MKSINSILINTSNLHSGGGVQVATSFIYELNRMNKYDFGVVVSSVIYKELVNLGVCTNCFNSFVVLDAKGITALFDYKFQKMLSSHRVVFTVFGPLYSWKKPNKSIVGFAQPWIVYPHNEIYGSFSYLEKAKTTIKYFLQWLFYLNSDQLIVELQHVMNRLHKRLNTQNLRISVISNCVSTIFLNRNQWSDLSYKNCSSRLTLGIVSRDYPHKNLSILPSVLRILKEKYQVEAKCLVTLTKEEWLSKDDEFREYIDNVGPITVTQCPLFYNLLDGVIFPSLLECFSATPIEAMIMKKPVFASDRLFVRQACGDFVNYFNPVNSDSVAESVYNYIVMDNIQQSHFIESAYDHALKYSNPSERANKYIDIIESV
jgi:glycosyltransferase involved in cell wall biosynthesis